MANTFSLDAAAYVSGLPAVMTRLQHAWMRVHSGLGVGMPEVQCINGGHGHLGPEFPSLDYISVDITMGLAWDETVVLEDRASAKNRVVLNLPHPIVPAKVCARRSCVSINMFGFPCSLVLVRPGWIMRTTSLLVPKLDQAESSMLDHIYNFR